MSGQENVSRIVDTFDKISKVFASMESFGGETGISKPELLALEAISRKGGMIMSDIAGTLEINLSTATGIADRLVEKKLVLRERNGGDRRIVTLAFTATGKKIAAAYQKQKTEMFARMMSLLSAEDQERLVAILEKIAGAMQGVEKDGQ